MGANLNCIRGLLPLKFKGIVIIFLEYCKKTQPNALSQHNQLIILPMMQPF